MRKFAVVCSVLAVLSLCTSVQADMSYWMSVDDIGNMDAVEETDGDTVTPGGYQTANPGRVAFKYNGTLSGETGGWDSIQIGYNWTPPGSPGATSMNGHAYPDLSGYDDFKMSFHNQDEDPIKVNMWLNTGYTDQGEAAVYAELTDATRWMELGQSDSVDLVLDFDNADLWVDGEKTAATTIPYLNHVTGIGFSVAYDTSAAYGYSVDVDTAVVPLPAAALLGLLGFGAAGIKLRRHV